MIVFLYVLLFGLSLWGVYLFVLLSNILGIETVRSKKFSNFYRIYLFLYLASLLLIILITGALFGGALGGKPNYLIQVLSFTYFHLNAIPLVFYWYIPLQYKWTSGIIGILAMLLPVLSATIFTVVMYYNSDFEFGVITVVCILALSSINLGRYNYKRFIQNFSSSL